MRPQAFSTSFSPLLCRCAMFVGASADWCLNSPLHIFQTAASSETTCSPPSGSSGPPCELGPWNEPPEDFLRRRAEQELSIFDEDGDSRFLDGVIRDEELYEEEQQRGSDVQLPLEGASVRRRLRFKQSPAKHNSLPGVVGPKEFESSEDEEPQTDWPRWRVLKAARVHFGIERAKRRRHGLTYRQAFNEAAQEFTALSPEEKEASVQRWKDQSSARPGKALGLSRKLFMSRPPDAQHDFDAYSPGKLFTWNHRWCLSDAAYMDLCRKYRETPDVLCLLTKDLDCIQRLFQALRKACKHTVQQYKCREFSCCLEMSLNSADFGRLHLHAFIERDCRADKAYARWEHVEELLKVTGVTPAHSVVCGTKSRGRGRNRALTEGHYYCQGQKIGHVMHFSTVPLFEKLFPDSRMITTLWRTRKMATQVAISEVSQSRDKAPGTVAMLQASMSLEYASQMEQDAVQAEIAWKACPFLPPSSGELDWVRQFAVVAARPLLSQSRAREFCRTQDYETSMRLRRFRFLIYDGPSRMGKTELAAAWFGATNTLIVNAQDVTTPNLRPMQSGKYTAILFDEGSWRLCALNKMVFQSSCRPVEMGQSQCNDRCYQVLFFRVPMIICSNDFWYGCHDESLRGWIQENSWYVPVTKLVFVPE